MKYYQPVTHYSWFSSHLKNISKDPVKFYNDLITSKGRLAHEISTKEQGTLSSQLLSERDYYAHHCSYFKIHPGIIDSFTKMKIDVPAKYIRIPEHPSFVPGVKEITGNRRMRSFAVRLTENALPVDGKHHVRTILASMMDRGYYVRTQEEFGWTMPRLPDDYSHKILLWIDIGETERMSLGDFTVWTYQSLLWDSSDDTATVETAQYELPFSETRNEGVIVPMDVIYDCVRLVVSVCFLMNSDSILIRPDVLNRDKGKEDINELHKKAYAEGKYGWEIGYDELFTGAGRKFVPSGKGLSWAHVRNMHWHVVRYGEGKKEAKVMLYMSTVVRPDLPFKP